MASFFRYKYAPLNDSQVLGDILNYKDIGHRLWGDKPYVGKTQEQIIVKYQMINHIHENG